MQAKQHSVTRKRQNNFLALSFIDLIVFGFSAILILRDSIKQTLNQVPFYSLSLLRIKLPYTCEKRSLQGFFISVFSKFNVILKVLLLCSYLYAGYICARDQVYAHCYLVSMSNDVSVVLSWATSANAGQPN